MNDDYNLDKNGTHNDRPQTTANGVGNPNTDSEGPTNRATMGDDVLEAGTGFTGGTGNQMLQCESESSESEGECNVSTPDERHTCSSQLEGERNNFQSSAKMENGTGAHKVAATGLPDGPFCQNSPERTF
jgi:hypothetical protein